MDRKISVFPLVPEEMDQSLWNSFLNANCTQCKSPKNGCTDEFVVMGQAVKCIEAWKERVLSHIVTHNIRDLLYEKPVETTKLLDVISKSNRDLARRLIDKMSEEGEIYKDKDGRWRLS